MRESKFRAWNKTTNQFQEFGTHWRKDCGQAIIPQYIGGKTFTLKSKFFYNQENELVWEQYTGLKDKNGVDVYEGDLIKYDNCDRITLVRWTEESHDHHPAFIVRDTWDQHGLYEVIGNIHENPELLK